MAAVTFHATPVSLCLSLSVLFMPIYSCSMIIHVSNCARCGVPVCVICWWAGVVHYRRWGRFHHAAIDLADRHCKADEKNDGGGFQLYQHLPYLEFVHPNTS